MDFVISANLPGFAPTQRITACAWVSAKQALPDEARIAEVAPYRTAACFNTALECKIMKRISFCSR